MEDEKLEKAVHSFICLWQVNSKAYMDVQAKENTWKEVVCKVGQKQRLMMM